MIEKLINPELRYGEPEYSQLGEEINEMKRRLSCQLDQGGKDLLEELMDTYIRQGNTGLRDAFTDGFCTAMKLMLEALSHPSE